MVMKGLVFGQSLMVKSTLLLCKSISPLLCTMGVHCCYLHVNYIVYKHFDMLLHVRSLDLTYAQNCRPVPLTDFEILGLKLKNKNNNNSKNWRNELFAISPMLVVQFRCTYMFTSAIIL